MAKKVVASLQGGAGSKKMTKVVKMVKSPKTGAYVFEEKVILYSFDDIKLSKNNWVVFLLYLLSLKQ